MNAGSGPQGAHSDDATTEDVPSWDLTPEVLREMWDLVDPVPAGLADRAAFALEVHDLTREDLELELLRLQSHGSDLAGARGGGEPVRTVTFGSDTVTVMLAISDVDGGHRIDGWVAPGGRRDIEVRTATGTTHERCDDTGRFALPLVPPGHLQLVLAADLEGSAPEGSVGSAPDGSGSSAPGHPGHAAGRSTVRAVVTPALTL